MNLQTNIKRTQSERGFTIVELLIVIVVIGILAAITLVAFNGVQNRAKTTQYNSDAAGITKAAEGYNADAQTYPTTAAQLTGSTIIKLPSNVTLEATAESADPTSNAGPSIASGVKTYKWKSCGSGSGLAVYYQDAGDSTSAGVRKVVAGTGC